MNSVEGNATKTGRTIGVWVVFLVGIVGAPLMAWTTRRHFVPGQWPGSQGWVPNEVPLMVGGILLLGSVAALLAWRAVWRALVILAFGIVQCMLQTGSPDWRFNAEISDYKRAVSGGSMFGDQYRERVGGRELVYWRWMSWGIDNGLGVIYDPEDRLMKTEEDRRAFEGQTHGVIFRLKRMEPGWYYVSHS